MRWNEMKMRDGEKRNMKKGEKKNNRWKKLAEQDELSLHIYRLMYTFCNYINNKKILY